MSLPGALAAFERRPMVMPVRIFASPGTTTSLTNIGWCMRLAKLRIGDIDRAAAVLDPAARRAPAPCRFSLGIRQQPSALGASVETVKIGRSSYFGSRSGTAGARVGTAISSPPLQTDGNVSRAARGRRSGV